MINWLIEQSLVCSLLIVLLLLFNKSLNKKLGAINTYKLWLIIPLSFVLPSIYQQMGSAASIEVFKFTAIHQLTKLHKVTDAEVAQPFLLIWAIGAAALLLLIFIHHCIVMKELKPAPTTLSTELKVKKVTFFKSAQLVSPVITGLFNKRLVIPNNFEQVYNREQQQLILKHECNHLISKDLYWNTLAILALAVFWFNPLFWHGYKRFRQQQELACDQRVLQNQPTALRQEYAKAMLIASVATKSNALTYLSYHQEVFMKERIKQLNNHKNKSWRIVIPSLAGLALLATIGHSVFAHNNKSYQSPVHREAPVYPKTAAENNVNGWVQLQFDIDRDGTVNKVSVIESSPDGVFDDSAIQALKKWRYPSSDETRINNLVQLDFMLGDENASTK